MAVIYEAVDHIINFVVTPGVLENLILAVVVNDEKPEQEQAMQPWLQRQGGRKPTGLSRPVPQWQRRHWLGSVLQDHHPKILNRDPKGRDPEGIPPLG